jgi:large subunit ribosomal protein L18
MNKKEQQLIKGQRERRVRRVRAKISGTSERPRLAVFRSLRSFSAQLIDDTSGKTLASVTQKEVAKKGGKPVELATELGTLMADKAKKAGVTSIVFDRRHYKYHGRVQAFADAAREAGLTF